MRTRINKIPKRSLKEVHELITKNECRADAISSGKNHRAVRKDPETGVRMELNFSSSSPRKLEEWIASNRIEHDRGDLQASDGSSAYAPVVKWDAMRSVLAFAIKHDLHSRQVDFLNAFAQANFSAQPKQESFPTRELNFGQIRSLLRSSSFTELHRRRLNLHRIGVACETNRIVAAPVFKPMQN